MDLCYIFMMISFAFSTVKANEANSTITISTTSLPWEDAVNGYHQLLNLEYMSQHGWDSLFGVNFSESSLWVAARAKYAPVVSWEGCARWSSTCVSGLLPAGSLADCLKNCQGETKYMLLKGDKCRCFGEEKSCIQRTTDSCDDPCRNNPNDWCGGKFGTEALYYTAPFGNLSFTTTKGNGSTICFLLYERDTFIHEEFSCESTHFKRSICKNDSELFEMISDDLINWFEALEVCKKANARLTFQHPKKTLQARRSGHWTSLRRGLSIKWTQTTDKEYPFCVSVRFNSQSNMMLYAGDCKTHKRYLYLADLQSSIVTTSSIALWPLGFFAIFPIVIVLIFLRKRSHSNSNVTNSPVDEEHYNVIYPDDIDSDNIEANELDTMSPTGFRRQEGGYDVTRLFQSPRPKDANYDSSLGCAAFPGKSGYDTVRSASFSKGHMTDPTHVYGMNIGENP